MWRAFQGSPWKKYIHEILLTISGVSALMQDTRSTKEDCHICREMGQEKKLRTAGDPKRTDIYMEYCLYQEPVRRSKMKGCRWMIREECHFVSQSMTEATCLRSRCSPIRGYRSPEIEFGKQVASKMSQAKNIWWVKCIAGRCRAKELTHSNSAPTPIWREMMQARRARHMEKKTFLAGEQIFCAFARAVWRMLPRVG